MQSPRHEEILELLAGGLNRSEIAEELNMSTNAVKKVLRYQCRRYDVDMGGLRRLVAGRADVGGVVSPP